MRRNIIYAINDGVIWMKHNITQENETNTKGLQTPSRVIFIAKRCSCTSATLCSVGFKCQLLLFDDRVSRRREYLCKKKKQWEPLGKSIFDLYIYVCNQLHLYYYHFLKFIFFANFTSWETAKNLIFIFFCYCALRKCHGQSLGGFVRIW